MFKNTTLSLLASLFVVSATFSACGTKNPEVSPFVVNSINYNIDCDSSSNLMENIKSDLEKKSRYGVVSGNLDFGISLTIDQEKSVVIINYVNNIAGLDGWKQNVVQAEIPYFLNIEPSKQSFLLSKNFTIDEIEDETDTLDSMENIRNDVLNIISPDFIFDKVDKINFDPKAVKFGKSVSVTNGLLHSEIKPVDGYKYKLCASDDGCTSDTHYQNIKVLLSDNSTISIIQPITDIRYDFIHNGSNVFVFKQENNTWIVKNNPQNIKG